MAICRTTLAGCLGKQPMMHWSNIEMGTYKEPSEASPKIHTIGKLASLLFRSTKRSLPDALAPFTPSPDNEVGKPVEAGREFGWTNVFDTPFDEDGYIVEFLGGRDVRIWAYVDQAGRAFATDDPVDMPPSSEAELEMVVYEEEDRDEEGEEKGYILVTNENGEKREIARYTEKDNGYEVYDSWYQLGEDFKEMAYSDLMTRLYCAAVIRPKLTGIEIPPRDINDLLAMLHGDNFAMCLRDIREMVKKAEQDPALNAPALVKLFADWLEEAGFDDRTSRSWLSGYGEEDEGPLRLVQTEHHANTYFILNIDEEFEISEQKIWAVESALNRLLLISESLGEKATLASMDECLRHERRIREGVALQAPDALRPNDANADTPAGEWSIRYKISEDMELFRLPYRFQARFHADVYGEGLVSFLVTTPNADLMPARKYNEEASCWMATTQHEREEEALAYSERIGIALAASAFSASRQIHKVTVKALPLAEEAGGISNAFYCVDFTRESFCTDSAYTKAAETNPHSFYESFGVLLGDEAEFVDPFASIKESDAYQLRSNAPEIGASKLPLTPDQQAALGVRRTEDLRIMHDAELLFAVDQIAERLRETASLQEAIRIVREAQESTANLLVVDGCTRIMTALVTGTLDARDAEALIECARGKDCFQEALENADELAEVDPEEAVRLLRGTIAQAEMSGHLLDTSEIVHRFFDSYASRFLYNRLSIDGGRQVEIIPSSLLACHLRIVDLCNESFSQSDNLADYGLRCLELAPTFALAYRHCGRSHMLIGDLDGAKKRLKACLMASLSPDDIAIAYYQLAYVEWKAERFRSAQACYCKSLTTSQVCARPASVELRDLMREEGLELIPEEAVDKILAEHDIPVAPMEAHLDAVKLAICAAVDAGVYPVAHSLMADYLRFRPDDVLANVLRSLERIGEVES